MYAAHDQISKTDVSCSWTPKAAKSSDVKTIEELYNIPSPPRVTQNGLTVNDVEELREKLKQLPPMGITWLLKEEPAEDCTIVGLVPDIRSIIFSKEYSDTDDQTTYLKNALKLTTEEITLIAEKTSGQSANVNWLKTRKLRITSSVFGQLIGSIGRNRYPPSLYTRLLGKVDLIIIPV